MIDAGVPIVMIGCKSGGHEAISRNGFLDGTFSYAFGDSKLPKDNYTITPQY